MMCVYSMKMGGSVEDKDTTGGEHVSIGTLS